MITNNRKLARSFNECFVNILTIVPILGNTSLHEKSDDLNNDNIENAITKVEGHPSILAIKVQMKKSNKSLTFQNVGTDKIASKSDDIPTRAIKEFGTFFVEIVLKTFNSCLETGSFSDAC